jgi:Wiskott-Aldrich syndrome protein
MPSQSTINADEKAKIKYAIPTSSNKIFFAAMARIYYAYPQPDKWSYAGLQGALVFALEHSNNTYHFKMVDLDGTRGVLWDHELYSNFEYNHERTFFHSFEGDVSYG